MNTVSATVVITYLLFNVYSPTQEQVVLPFVVWVRACMCVCETRLWLAVMKQMNDVKWEKHALTFYRWREPKKKKQNSFVSNCYIRWDFLPAFSSTKKKPIDFLFIFIWKCRQRIFILFHRRLSKRLKADERLEQWQCSNDGSGNCLLSVVKLIQDFELFFLTLWLLWNRSFLLCLQRRSIQYSMWFLLNNLSKFQCHQPFWNDGNLMTTRYSCNYANENFLCAEKMTSFSVFPFRNVYGTKEKCNCRRYFRPSVRLSIVIYRMQRKLSFDEMTKWKCSKMFIVCWTELVQITVNYKLLNWIGWEILTGIVWLPCKLVMAAWASWCEPNLTKAQPEKCTRNDRKLVAKNFSLDKLKVNED